MTSIKVDARSPRADVFEEVRDQAGELLQLPLEQVFPAPDNPRKDLGDLAELTRTIAAMGVLQPLVVTPTLGERYMIVAGHRRFAAAALAGLKTVPAIVRPMTDEERVEAMLVENVQREDVKPLEEAGAYRRLIDEFGLKQRVLAERVGRSQGHISKRLALLELPEPVAAKVDSGGITIAEGVELAKLKDHPERLKQAMRTTPYRTVEMNVAEQRRAAAPKCKSCSRPMRWVTNRLTGRKMPVDFDPHEDGNVVVDANDRADVCRATPSEIPSGSTLHFSHFATCPNADAHRRSR